MKDINTYLLLFFLWIFSLGTSAKAAVPADSLPLPFQKALDSSRGEDNLEEWSYAWINFITSLPEPEYNILKIPVQKIWRKPANKKEEMAWFYLLVNLGYSALQQGNIILSTDIYEKSWRFYHEADSVSSAQALEYVFKPLGNNYTRLGDYERALYIQKEGLQLARKLEDNMQQASLLNNLAITSRWNAQAEKALVFCKEGLQKVDRNSPLEGLLYSTNADILFKMGRLKEAGKSIGGSIAIFNRLSHKDNPNTPYWLGSALQVSARIQLKLAHYTLAEQENKKALAVFEKNFPHSRRREKAKIYVTFGNIALQQKNTQRAETFFDEAMQVLIPSFSTGNSTILPDRNKLYAENTFLEILTGKGRVLHLEGSDSLSLSCYSAAFTVVQKLRKTIFSKEAKTLLQQQNLQAADEAIAIAHHLYRQTKRKYFAELALTFVEQYKAQLLLDELTNNRDALAKNKKDSLLFQDRRLQQAITYNEQQLIEATLERDRRDSLRWKQQLEQLQYKRSLLQPEIEKKYVEWYDPVTYSVGKIKKLINAIPPNTMVWEYFDGPESWYALALSRQGIMGFEQLGNSDTLRRQIMQFVQEWFTNGPSAMLNRPGKYFEEAKKLYKTLAGNLPTEEKHLIIIPGGVLGRLPFEALITDGNYSLNPAKWHYLLKENSLSEAYSLSVFQQSQEAFLQSKPLKGFTGLFISPTDSGLQSLSGVEEEVKNIRRFIRGDFYVNEKATGAHLINAISRSEVVHISTHAFLLGKQKIPALQMADEKLFLTGLSEKEAHPSLIFLGACQSANGLLSSSEGIISLARKFTAVGAGGVVAGLWDLNDDVTARLTGIFYKNLKQNSHKALALHRAKLSWLENEQISGDKKLPYYWAGLIYFGNLQPLKNQLSGSRWPDRLLLIVGTGVGLFIVLFFIFRSLYRKGKFNDI